MEGISVGLFVFEQIHSPSICDDSRAPFYNISSALKWRMDGISMELFVFYELWCSFAHCCTGPDMEIDVRHTSLVTDIRCLNIDHAEYECPNPRITPKNCLLHCVPHWITIK
ncbi:hypothetical protein CEXT_478951 [Caerostris extrusa]|uniref:Uncharacterized protein n=1 Tax=Caerostris extrusa TaxID=172846 RepID=A0AAV4Y9T2_CAEEX|nr:hypothetical protein CEXT_478951 [Caerostris extrusa]